MTRFWNYCRFRFGTNDTQSFVHVTPLQYIQYNISFLHTVYTFCNVLNVFTCDSKQITIIFTAFHSRFIICPEILRGNFCKTQAMAHRTAQAKIFVRSSDKEIKYKNNGTNRTFLWRFSAKASIVLAVLYSEYYFSRRSSWEGVCRSPLFRKCSMLQLCVLLVLERFCMAKFDCPAGICVKAVPHCSRPKC